MDETLERYLCNIFIGQIIDVVDNTTLIFKQPDNLLKLKSNLEYDAAYNNAVASGLLTLDQIEELLVSRNVFTEEDQKLVDVLENRIEAQEVLLSKVIRVNGNPKRVEGIIKGLREELIELKTKKYSMLTMSADNKAEDSRSLYLCWGCTYKDTNELYWKTHEALLGETNLAFKNKILSIFLKFYRGINTKTIRTIARSNLWRIRYVSSMKTSDSLFGVPTSDYTNDQLNLVYWSNYYQNIYEMMPEDRPSDLVIEDDDSLDSYMKAYYEERNREDAARKSKHQTKGSMSAFDKEEVVITKANPLYQDIKYDKPREAQQIKDKTAVRKRTRIGSS